jgi:ATP-dependent Lhr-like helicase
VTPVFCDSRSRVEELASDLRRSGVDTYVSHSSIGREERQRAEAAFAAGGNCVIVATSTLELGIDVGDLDRVIQIDAPHTVSAMLQRLGRTGRRPGTQRNYLFLTTSAEALVRAAGLMQLFAEGYLEPIVPPAEPWGAERARSGQLVCGRCTVRRGREERPQRTVGWQGDDF